MPPARAGHRLPPHDCDRLQAWPELRGLVRPRDCVDPAADGYVFLTQTKPSVGVAATKLVKVKKVVKTKAGKRVTKTTVKRVQFVIKPTFRPLAPKKQPIVVVAGGPVDHLILNAPTIASSGTPFTINVRAEDAYGNPASGYTGTVNFSSTDPAAFLPTPYTFTSDDLGAKNFGGVILRADRNADDHGHRQLGPRRPEQPDHRLSRCNYSASALQSLRVVFGSRLCTHRPTLPTGLGRGVGDV